MLKRGLILLFLLGSALALHNSNVTVNETTYLTSNVNATYNFTIWNQWNSADAINQTKIYNITTGADPFNITSAKVLWWDNETNISNITAWNCEVYDTDSDDYRDTVNCTLGNILYPNVTKGNYLNLSLTVIASVDQNVTWNVTTWDNSSANALWFNNTNMTIDVTAPSVSSVFINDTVVQPTNWTKIFAYVTDFSGIENVTIDFTALGLTLLNFTDFDSDQNYTFRHDIPSSANDGAYNLEINATDIFDHETKASYFTLTVDGTDPNVTTVYPATNLTTANNRPVIWANVTDNLSNATECNITAYFNNSAQPPVNVDVNDDGLCIYTLDSPLPNSTGINATFIVKDQAGNWNMTDVWSGTYFVDTDSVSRNEGSAFRGYSNNPYLEDNTVNLRTTLQLENSKNENVDFGTVNVEIDENSTNEVVLFSNGTVVPHSFINNATNDTVWFEVGNIAPLETRTYYIDYNSTSIRYTNDSERRNEEIVIDNAVNWTEIVTATNGLEISDTIQMTFPVPYDAENIEIHSVTDCSGCDYYESEAEDYARAVFFLDAGTSRAFNITYDLPAPHLYENKSYMSTKNDTTVFWFEKLSLENRASKDFNNISIQFDAPEGNLTFYNLTNSTYDWVNHNHKEYFDTTLTRWLNWTENNTIKAGENYTYFMKVNTTKLNVTNFKWTSTVDAEQQYPLNLSAMLQSYESETFEFVPEIVDKGNKTIDVVTLTPYQNTSINSYYNLTILDDAKDYTLRYNLTSDDGTAYSGTKTVTLVDTPIVPIVLNDTEVGIGEWMQIDSGFFNNTETTQTVTYHFDIFNNESALVSATKYPINWGTSGTNPIDLSDSEYTNINRVKINNTIDPGEYYVYAALTEGTSSTEATASGTTMNSSSAFTIPETKTCEFETDDITAEGTFRRTITNTGNTNTTVWFETVDLGSYVTFDMENETTLLRGDSITVELYVDAPATGLDGYVKFGACDATSHVGVKVDSIDTTGTSGDNTGKSGGIVTIPNDNNEETPLSETEVEYNEVLDNLDSVKNLNIPITVDQDTLDKIDDLIAEDKFSEASTLIEELKASVGTASIVDDYEPRLLSTNDDALNHTKNYTKENDLETINDDVIYSVEAKVIKWVANSSTKYYTTIMLSAKLRSDRENAYLVVNVPKSLAATTKDLRFIDTPVILNEDPIFAFPLTTLGKTYSYQFSEDLDLGDINSIVTTAIAKRVPRCGDGLCEDETCCEDCGCNVNETCNEATHKCQEKVVEPTKTKRAETTAQGTSPFTMILLVVLVLVLIGGGAFVYVTRKKTAGGLTIKKVLEKPGDYPSVYLSGQLKTLDETSGYLTDNSGSIKVSSQVPINDSFVMIKGTIQNGTLIADLVMPVEMTSNFAAKHVGDSAQTPNTERKQ